MIGFYKDTALTERVSTYAPKRFLVPASGGSRTGTLYLGDPYTATTTATAAAGAATLVLDQVFEFPASGSAVIYIPASQGVPASEVVIHYTGITGTSLTGVTGISASVAAQLLVRPNTVWRTTGNVILMSAGGDCPVNLQVAFGLPASATASNRFSAYGVSGGSYILAAQSIVAGVENALRIDLKVTSQAGADAQFSNWQVQTGTFYPYDASDSSAIPVTAIGVSAIAPGDLLRQDQAVKLPVRVLPADRQVSNTTPGFILGRYRWRDENTINAAAMLPTRWDTDLAAIGLEKFVSGIGDDDDLKPLGLTESANSVFLTVKDGAYFDGASRFFLPGTAVLDFLPASSLSLPLSQVPAQGKPVFVGRWRMDKDGFYSIAVDYRKVSAFVNNGVPQYQLNRRGQVVTINQTLPPETVFIGTLSGTGTDTLNLPLYPVLSVDSLYIPLYGNNGAAILPDFSLDQDAGTVQVTYTPGGLYTKNQPVYAICTPALAVQYEPEPTVYATAHSYRIATAGPSCRQSLASLNPAQQYSAGIWVDGAFTYGLQGSYTVLTIDRATMVNEGVQSFDLTDVNNAQALADYLNGLDSSKIVIVVSYDDPQINHTASGLDAAMSQCGASDFYLSDAFSTGSAYILVGIPGTGSGVEFYRGAGDNDPLAQVVAQLTITEGDIPGVSAASVTPAASVTTDQRQVPVDLNPAFSGVANGFIYLQHRRRSPASITLAADKPLIAIPATYQSIVNLVAYGPVYFNGDYSLLSATVKGPVGDETVPNITMKVIVDPATWSGQINYQDPTTTDVTVTSGADGVVNLVYTPQANWGWYVPTSAASGGLAGVKTTNTANDTIVLPVPLPISQVFDGSEWMATLYSVLNDSPVYGKVGADTTKGQLAWMTSGTPGTSSYRTNGQLIAWGGSDPIIPIQALDANGNNQDASQFTGEVVALVYSQAVPAAANLGAYFLTFLQRVQIQLQDSATGLLSNPILLQMEDPALIVENPWLILGDSVQGRLNQYRLSWNGNALFLNSRIAPTSGFGVGGFDTQPFGS